MLVFGCVIEKLVDEFSKVIISKYLVVFIYGYVYLVL